MLILSKMLFVSFVRAILALINKAVSAHGVFHPTCKDGNMVAEAWMIQGKKPGWWLVIKPRQKGGVMEYNVCKTCGACDGRCGLMIGEECLNCHKTRETGDFVLHAELERTPEELKKTGEILK